MAAYGSLVSLMNILDTIQLHPCPPISLDQIQVESLTENITFLQEFLEGYSMESDYRNEADPLEMRIVDAAYAAEDVIESHIVDQIDPQSTSKKIIRFFNSLSDCFQSVRKAADCGFIDRPTSLFNRRLQKVIEGFDLLKKEAMEIKGIRGVRDPLLRISEPAASLRSTYTRQSVGMVGFDEVLVEVMDKLTGGERGRQTIPIVGMGGTGKTTLALNIYHHQVIVQHFDFRAWVTISQEYRIKECLLELLQDQESEEDLDEQELGIKLHKKLSGRRYLIILDDVWDIEVWDHLRRYFPNNQNGSRIVITTRISNFDLTDSYVLKIGFLDKDKSWSLFSKVVFGEEGCPSELKKIGLKIVENCRGLPLSIVVVGGLLAKSKHTREYWEYIAENLNSTVNSEDDENCLKILHMSYKHLPIYLKPCFLYMGVFPEDQKIHVSKLIKLWVSEGFVRPISGKSSEEAAHKYLQELISRNMVYAHKFGSVGSIKYCKIHDLLRDVSMRQAAKEMFYGTGTQHRIVISTNTPLWEVMPLARSVICDSKDTPPLHKFRLLRILSGLRSAYSDLKENKCNLVNIRCIVFQTKFRIPSSIHLFWNLQTLIVSGFGGNDQLDIWNMPQLKHLKTVFGFALSDFPSNNHIVLANLQTLGVVTNFKCCPEVVKRIPNIKKLLVKYTDSPEESSRDYCVDNLSHLHKLESLYYYQHSARGVEYLHNLTFPHSLKKLTFEIHGIHWDDNLDMIGSLPLLEKLKLLGGVFRGSKWETTEGQFTRLRFLSVLCRGWKYWKTESSHFPCLNRLVLGLNELNEIPSEIGEIPTMKSIRLINCSESAVISARKIVEEQEELYGEVGLLVQVTCLNYSMRKKLSSLTTPNFQLKGLIDSDMAAYGSLVSVMNILDSIQLHPCPPISLDKIQVESLTEKLTFLQEFLEGYSMESDYRNEADPLEMHIADAAYAAEDLIESHIVDQIDPQPSENIQGVWKAAADCGFIAPPTNPFCQRLQKVIEGFDLLKKEAMEIKGIRGVRDPLLRISEPAASLRSTYTGQSVAMVGFDEVLVEVMDKLTGGERGRQTIPIVGMGGTGKTTLALNVYQHQVIVQHFDLRVWVTISQEYRIRDCLLQLLQESGENLDEQELGIELHKKLSGRRYLIILDDIWDIEVWDHLRRYFPNNQNGSRIVITTRISNFELTDSYVLKIGFLDKDKSWSLFSKVVFGEEGCPPELKEIGLKIVENCRGLPLSIVVVGGLLAKSRHTREYWEYMAENLSSTVNSEDDENCLKILHMSYKHLPVYLKLCFLYMGVFPEDETISVSKLIKLWVSEGFVRPISDKSLEEVAYKYLQELISRNMVLAHELGSIGSIKYCKVHDLLRDLSLRQAAKEMFYGIGTHRRIVISENMSYEEVQRSMQYMPLVRSVIFDSKDTPTLHRFRLLRLLSSSRYADFDLQENKFNLVNLRCIVLQTYFKIPSSIHLFWNLQTLIGGGIGGIGGSNRLDIWNMPQLRHLKTRFGFALSDFPSSNHIVLANLQTLGVVTNFKCCAEVVKRIPNIKKFLVKYTDSPEESSRDYCVNNLSLLHKLKVLHYDQYSVRRVEYLENLTFPRSLKKLTFMSAGDFHWDDKMDMIGSLPLLEKLKLLGGVFRGGKWETTEGQFTRLRFLSVSFSGLKYWSTESSHFPCLNRLALFGLNELNEIPSEIGEIPTMKSIRLIGCSESAVISAKKIVEEQEELYGEVGLLVQVTF